MRTSPLRSRGLAAGAVLATVALALAACSGDGSGSGSGSTATGPTSGAPAGTDEPVVGATLLSLEYPFLVTLGEAMQTAADEHGLDLVSLDPRQETSTEFSQIEDLITRKVDAIVMIPVDQASSQAAAKAVNEAGIPLLLVNTRFSDDFDGDYVSYIGSDDTEAGEIQGQYLADQLPDGGNVIYLVGQYGGASTERRKTGFYSALEGRDDIKVVTETEALGSRAEAKSVMEDLLQRYGKGEVQAVICQSDEMALGAASAIAEAGRSDEFSIVMGVDGSEAGLAAVQDGTITATVFQDAVGQGTAAMEAAAKVVAGETIDKEIVIPFQLVTKDNVADFVQ